MSFPTKQPVQKFLNIKIPGTNSNKYFVSKHRQAEENDQIFRSLNNCLAQLQILRQFGSATWGKNKRRQMLGEKSHYVCDIFQAPVHDSLVNIFLFCFNR